MRYGKKKCMAYKQEEQQSIGTVREERQKLDLQDKGFLKIICKIKELKEIMSKN